MRRSAFGANSIGANWRLRTVLGFREGSTAFLPFRAQSGPVHGQNTDNQALCEGFAWRFSYGGRKISLRSLGKSVQRKPSHHALPSLKGRADPSSALRAKTLQAS